MLYVPKPYPGRTTTTIPGVTVNRPYLVSHVWSPVEVVDINQALLFSSTTPTKEHADWDTGSSGGGECLCGGGGELRFAVCSEVLRKGVL